MHTSKKKRYFFRKRLRYNVSDFIPNVFVLNRKKMGIKSLQNQKVFLLLYPKTRTRVLKQVYSGYISSQKLYVV